MARRPSAGFFASRGRRQVSSQELAVISCDQTLTKRIKSVTIRLQLLKECFHGREQVQEAEGLTYKGHPLRRVDNLIYYGTMAEKYIIMMQILNTKKEQDMEVATKVSIQLQLTDPELSPGTVWSRRARRTASTRRWTSPPSGWIVLLLASCKKQDLFPALQKTDERNVHL